MPVKPRFSECYDRAAVKDLDHYLLVGYLDADQRTHYSFLEREHPESRLTRQELDILRGLPKATQISVNGLTQDTFEYLIAQYGSQFKVINFWKCPLVRDLTPLEFCRGSNTSSTSGTRKPRACGTFQGTRPSRVLGLMISDGSVISHSWPVRPPSRNCTSATRSGTNVCWIRLSPLVGAHS